ncbi:DNA primase [Dehalococcoides mccartyi]|uniref:DNA primase n=1 Tax=Dehalococcoides mccartyi TaxID=61435 RepID=A0A328EP83_9CHLR|nr:DNA primase [Dehalococcoides mccartyi]
MTTKDSRGEKTATADAFSEAMPELLESHLRHLLEETGLDLDIIRERKYRSIVCKAELGRFGFAPVQQRVPGLLIPLWGVDGQAAGYQLRPDNPRANNQSKPVKYELPAGSANRLDCPPRCQKALGNPKLPLWITEGSKKADALAGRDACAVSVTGVWGFKGKNEFGGVTFLADWDYIALKDRTVYLAFDSDIVTKEPVRKALSHVAEHIRRKGAKVQIVQLPRLEGQNKTGIDDYLLQHSLAEAEKLVGDFKLEEEEDRERYVSGFILRDGTVGEMVVDEDDRYFMVSDGGAIKKVWQYDTSKVTYLRPLMRWSATWCISLPAPCHMTRRQSSSKR